MDKRIGRRELFKNAALSGAGLGLLGGVFGSKDAEATVEKLVTAQATAAAKVPTRTLGDTGEQIPILLMGGSQKFDPVYDKMLHRAFKEGMFYYDTAEKYANGQSHATLRPFIEQVGRENIWITSKSGMFPGRPAAPPEMYRKTIEKEFDVLGTDHIDMYFFHGLRHLECLEPEYMKMTEGLKKAGRTKFFGFSCHDGNVVELMNKAAKIGSPTINAIMFRYNFTKYGDYELNKAMDAAVKAGIGLIAMKTQSSVPQDSEEVLKFQSDNFTLHQARLKAAWADERISACVSGINNLQILRTNVDAAKSTVQLSMNEMMQLHQYAARTASSRCQGCNQICESRIDGDTRVADMLRYLMYHECYGEKQEARELFKALRPEERQIAGIDLTSATEACPQGIDIAKRLAQAHSLLA